jgi:hypothetical protein
MTALLLFRTIGVGIAVAAIVGRAAPAIALPTMIRLGYADCAACHVSPQGGGLLTPYGRGIDQAQSLRGGDYRPSDREWARALSLDGRILQDLRVVLQDQRSASIGQSGGHVFRPRLLYRNATDLTHGWRGLLTVTADGERAPRPDVTYEPAAHAATLFVNTAMVQYRASTSLEVAAGRDQLPSGVNVPDLGLYIKSRHRFGYYDAPTQVKLFWSGARHQVSPFVFTAGGNEARGETESGGGTIAEFDVLGHHRTVVGMTLLRAHAANGDRRVAGAHARLGFGAWGILAEHDVTTRTRVAPVAASFDQYASYGQIFWALREWLVVSAIAERLHVDAPFEQHRRAGKLELAARLASQLTISIGARLERDDLAHRTSRSVILQAAVKTVQ